MNCSTPGCSSLGGGGAGLGDFNTFRSWKFYLYHMYINYKFTFDESMKYSINTSNQFTRYFSLGRKLFASISTVQLCMKDLKLVHSYKIRSFIHNFIHRWSYNFVWSWIHRQVYFNNWTLTWFRRKSSCTSTSSCFNRCLFSTAFLITSDMWSMLQTNILNYVIALQSNTVFSHTYN